MQKFFTYQGEEIYAHHVRDEKPNVTDFYMQIHDTHELFYFISGRGVFFVESKPYRLYPGCVMLIRAGEVHSIQVDPELPYERMVFNISPEFLRKIDPNDVLVNAYLNRSIGQHNLYEPDMFNADLINKCFRNISDLMSEIPDEQKSLLILSYVAPILFEMHRVFDFHSKNQTAKKGTKDNIANKLVNYINVHLCENFTLETLSDEFFASKTYLNKEFKQVTGSNIWEYVVVKRLTLARQHIRGGMSAGDAAAVSGWNDYSAFYRSYKSHFNMSPSEEKANQNFASLYE